MFILLECDHAASAAATFATDDDNDDDNDDDDDDNDDDDDDDHHHHHYNATFSPFAAFKIMHVQRVKSAPDLSFLLYE